MAAINAKDVVSPEDLEHPGATCLIKMSRIGIEGLRQAFPDPGSRVELGPGEVGVEPSPQMLGMAWEGGFLDGTMVRLNPNLNVLVGGRGAGKSTVIESLRYVLGLDPIGEAASKAHQGIVHNVLRSGTRISLLVRTHGPGTRLVREEQVLDSMAHRLEPLRECLADLRQELPLDLAFLSRGALDSLPGKDILEVGNRVLEKLSTELQDLASGFRDALGRADDGIAQIRTKSEDRRREVQGAYEAILRELERSAVHGEEFIRLRGRIERLRPLRREATLAREHMGSIDDERVRELIEDLLEGGKDAFETRRHKYGF